MLFFFWGGEAIFLSSFLKCAYRLIVIVLICLCVLLDGLECAKLLSFIYFIMYVCESIKQ